jgi:iron complex transport system substrate-binding protein
MLVTILALASVVAATVWSAALPPATSSLRARVASSVPPGPFPKTALDILGRPVTLPAPPRRIVSITLGADEMLLDLVSPERIVGVTPFIDSPGMSPVSARAPRGAARVTAEPEALLALAPDIVFASAYTRAEALSVLSGAGIPVIGSGSHATFDEILQAVTTIGDAVGEPDRARAMVTEARARIAGVTSRPRGRRPRVLLWDGGYTYGKGTLEDEMVRLAGGINVAAGAGLTGPVELTEEGALGLEPDVVIVATDGDSLQLNVPDLLGKRPIWGAVAAVRRGDVFGVPRVWIGSVSHHAVRALEAVALVLDRMGE